MKLGDWVEGFTRGKKMRKEFQRIFQVLFLKPFNFPLCHAAKGAS